MLTTLFALPSWLKVAIVSIALIGAVNVRHWWIERGMKKEIATLTQQLKDEKVTTAILQQQVTEVVANRDKLRATIVEQNSAIEVWKQTARTLEAKATARVVRVVAEGTAAAAELRSPQTQIPPGHIAMNTWLHGVFIQ